MSSLAASADTVYGSTAVRRCALFVVLLTLLGACESGAGQWYAGQATIRGVFHLEDRTLSEGWVEMLQLSGPSEERCGPGDCGIHVRPLAEGTHWDPGRWRVIPPNVPGWETPDPVEITVRADELTTFDLHYLPT
jgi:hypothetical protein